MGIKQTRGFQKALPIIQRRIGASPISATMKPNFRFNVGQRVEISANVQQHHKIHIGTYGTVKARKLVMFDDEHGANSYIVFLDNHCADDFIEDELQRVID